MTQISHRKRFGFSLVELLVTIVILSMLAALLLPSLARSRALAEGTACRSNLRQLAIAAQLYVGSHDGRFPPAYATPSYDGGRFTQAAWDFATVVDWSNGGERSKAPGLLWENHDAPEIHQCPSFDGEDNALDDPYTGYNYNTSYLGHGPGEVEGNKEPALISQVTQPAATALFGDGEKSGGANKFMRAPYDDIEGGGDKVSFRHEGTQGYRHNHKTNVAFVDGHVASHADLFSVTGQEADGTGFLSADNELYDLR